MELSDQDVTLRHVRTSTVVQQSPFEPCMRLVILSDLHDNSSFRQWVLDLDGHFDGVLLAGDLIDQFGMLPAAQSKTARDWVVQLAERFRLVGVCSGNHDDTAIDWVARLDVPNVASDGRLLMIEQNGVHLAVAAATNNWLDIAKYSETNRCLIEELAQTVADYRLLLHHTPPTPSAISSRHQPDLDGAYLRKLLEENPGIDVVCSGHIHGAVLRENGAWYDYVGRSLCLNAGQVEAAPFPFHIEIQIYTDRMHLTWNGYDPLAASALTDSLTYHKVYRSI